MMKIINSNEVQLTYYKNKTVFICSYCFESLDERVSVYQKKVFEHLEIKINQYVGSIRHPEFMDYIVKNFDFDFFIFFDIDCIPMKKEIIEYIIERIGFDSLIGIEQQCNSNESIDHIYAGPACFGISKVFYEEIGKPSFQENKRSDVGEEITYTCEKLSKKYHLFRKNYSENKLWKLGNDYFGHGTVYEDELLYHQFQICQNVEKFIQKCKEVLENLKNK